MQGEEKGLDPSNSLEVPSAGSGGACNNKGRCNNCLYLCDQKQCSAITAQVLDAWSIFIYKCLNFSLSFEGQFCRNRVPGWEQVFIASPVSTSCVNMYTAVCHAVGGRRWVAATESWRWLKLTEVYHSCLPLEIVGIQFPPEFQSSSMIDSAVVA